ncbi:hypothetical protein F2Q70_00016786 [Brassica cretica]|uniref:Uncharacterized protein n=1 Tax=Brassica cretica TaxID=69181 RepID=A0A8S9HUI0_BRACR|nr:hypothetical protein F2Q70_00016786 [Brassica cretica]
MGTESGPDSSSIGCRVRSNRLRVVPAESMDSSDSSLDLTAAAKNPKVLVTRNTLPAEGSQYPPIGPPLVIGAEEVTIWRKKYNLPDDVGIRAPEPGEVVSDFGVDEVPVYEGYFVSGFRDHVPSLIAKISETLGISPAQLNPPAWRTLIALQNLGDLYGFVIGVAEVLCSYSVVPLNSAEWRNYLHPRTKETPVREVPKKERKKLLAFEGNWTEKFAFSHLPGFSATWRLYDLPRVDYFSGRDTIEQVSKLPPECHQVSFLVSEAALKRCSVWGEMSGTKGNEALVEYKKALEVMSAKKAAPKRAISTEDDEVQFIGGNKRRAGAAAAPSSSKKKSKVPGSSPKDSPSAPYDWATVLNNLNTKVFPSTPVLLASEGDSSTAIQSLQGDLLEVASQLYHLSSPKDSPSAPYDWATVLNNLNTKVFPSTPVLLASEGNSSTAIQSLQGDLLEVASQLYHLGERMDSAVSTKVEMDNLTSQLRKEKDAVLAKDREIKELTLKVKNKEEAGELAAAENASLRSQLKEREEELIDLKDAAATFDVDKTMAVNSAKIVARWELMREWLSGRPTSGIRRLLWSKTKTPEPSANEPPPN